LTYVKVLRGNQSMRHNPVRLMDYRRRCHRRHRRHPPPPAAVAVTATTAATVAAAAVAAAAAAARATTSYLPPSPSPPSLSPARQPSLHDHHDGVDVFDYHFKERTVRARSRGMRIACAHLRLSAVRMRP